MFETVEEVAEGLARAKYLTTPTTHRHVFVAAKQHKALLVEGPPGSGKSEIALAVAQAAGTDCVRLQCYEGIDEDAVIQLADPPVTQGSHISVEDRLEEKTRGERHSAIPYLSTAKMGVRLLPGVKPVPNVRLWDKYLMEAFVNLKRVGFPLAVEMKIGKGSDSAALGNGNDNRSTGRWLLL